MQLEILKLAKNVFNKTLVSHLKLLGESFLVSGKSAENFHLEYKNEISIKRNTFFVLSSKNAKAIFSLNEKGILHINLKMYIH